MQFKTFTMKYAIIKSVSTRSYIAGFTDTPIELSERSIGKVIVKTYTVLLRETQGILIKLSDNADMITSL